MKVVTEDILRSSRPGTFEDSVSIEGNVRSGAHIRVHGDLNVRGDVKDALIEVDGDVRITGGFLGRGTGRVTCGGDFSACFVQSQRVEARGHVTVDKALISCEVFSSGNVNVGNENGVIVGGSIHALGNVQAAVLGGKRPVQTRIEVGVDPILALRVEELEREAMELTRKRIGFLKDAAIIAERPGDGDDGECALDMKTAADAIMADIVAAGEEILEVRKRTALDRQAFVKVGRNSYPPLEVSICFSRLVNERETGPVVFRLLEDRIVLDTWNLE